MGLYSTEAFVLRSYSLAEADKICVFLTKEHGKLRGVAHGARKMKSRFGSSLEPMTQVALTYYHKEGRDLMNVSTCDIIRSYFYEAARNVETASAFSYISELLTEFIPDSEPDERLYRLISATLGAIETGKSLDWTLRYFETWVLRLGGFFPDVGNCSVCSESVPMEHPIFISMDGTPRCFGCSNGRGMTLNAPLKRLIYKMLSTHPASNEAGAIAASDAAALSDINYQIIRHALERDLRSRGPMKQLGGV
ncbi:MAG: DNA repair protein RecO [Blastocatellia bacterium]